MTLGLAIDDISMVGGQKAFRGVSELARERGIDVLFFHFDMRNGASGMPPEWASMAEATDGIVALQPWVSEDAYKSFRARLPSAPMVNSHRIYPGCPGTPADSYEGMREAVGHLVERHGYRKIAFLRGPAGNWAGQERYRAYLDELGRRGIPVDPRLSSDNVNWDSGPEAIRQLLDSAQFHP